MKRSKKVIFIVLLVAATAAISFLATRIYDTASRRNILESNQVVSKMEEIGAYIDYYFIDDYDESELTAAAADAAANAMVEATGDRWSYYISAADMDAFNERQNNAYVGVGITIEEVEAGFLVVSVAKDGPAEQAGVQAGDILIEVEGEAVTGLGLDSTKELVRGEEGTQVRACFLRDDLRLDVTMTRANIITDVTTGELLEGNIGLVTISNFETHCAEQTLACIDSLIEQGAEALLFDVRFNPGGRKDEMVEVLDALLPEGDIFRSIDYKGREEVDTSDADCLELPMAVLINEDSYSAAEFFAAALQEYGVATVVGSQTCGKGNFQYTFDLSDGSGLALSVGKYFTPSGKSLTDVGVTPDVPVDMEEDAYYDLYLGNLEQEDDPQLQAALEVLRQKIS